jgi:hypothetical protein
VTDKLRRMAENATRGLSALLEGVRVMVFVEDASGAVGYHSESPRERAAKILRGVIGEMDPDKAPAPPSPATLARLDASLKIARETEPVYLGDFSKYADEPLVDGESAWQFRAKSLAWFKPTERTPLLELMAIARARFALLSPEEQAEHRAEQRQSWARGQVAMHEYERELRRTGRRE